MPTYTLSQLHTLASSELVASPDFKWNDWESVFRTRRRSSVSNRPEFAPKKQVEFDEEELENDPDKAMAAFFLRKNPNPSPAQPAQKDSAPAAPQAAAQDSAIDDGEEDGWTSVVKPRKRGSSRTSFSKWGGRA